MRVAVLGLGNAGSGLHLPALARIRGVTVVGACDRDGTRRERVARRFGIPVFDELAVMLDRARPEVVVVATPPELHAEHCVLSFSAGAHVVCEKPFATSVTEAERIIAAAQAANRQVAVNHEFREMPIYRALRDQVGKPEVGELRFVQAWQVMDLPPWREAGWRGERPRWTLYEAGIHLLDFVIALYGERPSGVTAVTSSCGVGDAEADAVAVVTLEFSGGRLGLVLQDRLSVGDTQYFEVRADCARASLRASFGGRARLSVGLLRSMRPHLRFERGGSGLAWREAGPRRTLLERNPPNPAALATRRLLEKTLAAFRDGGAPPASGADGREVLRVVAACYRSAATGRRVALEGPEAAELATLEMGARGGP